MHEVHDTEDGEMYVRGPDDLAAWARVLRLGWRPGVIVAHLDEQGRFRCLTDLPNASLEYLAANSCWLLGPVAECGCERVVALSCGSGPTTPTGNEIEAVRVLTSMMWDRRLDLLDVLLIREHRWRSLREMNLILGGSGYL